MSKIRGSIREDDTKPKKVVRVLYIEADEDHVASQRGRCMEVPLVYVHEGIERWKKRVVLKRVHYFSGMYSNMEDLWFEVLDYIQTTYDEGRIERVFIIGDGASWIKAGAGTIPKAVFVLDKFHLLKYITSAAGGNEPLRKEIWHWVYCGDRTQVNKALKDALKEAQTATQVKALNDCKRYISKNWAGIESWKKYAGELHGCSAEGHVSHVLSARLSSRPSGWSKAGVDKMARLRAMKANGMSIRDAFIRQNYATNSVMKVSRRFIDQTRQQFQRSVEVFDNIPVLNGPVTQLRRILKSIILLGIISLEGSGEGFLSYSILTLSRQKQALTSDPYHSRIERGAGDWVGNPMGPGLASKQRIYPWDRNLYVRRHSYFSGCLRGEELLTGQERFREIRKVLLAVLLLNYLVCLAKLIVGYLSHSASMVADGFHSLSDGSSNIVGLVGMRLAARPVDESHPYGHGKFENLTAVGIGAMLFFVAFEVVREGWERLHNPVPLSAGPLQFIVMACTIAVNLAITVYESNKGKVLGSDVLISDSAHTRTDLYVSISVIFSLIASRLGYPVIDVVASLLIAVLIVRAGAQIVLESSGPLCDAAVLDPEEIAQVVKSVAGVVSCHKVRSRGLKNQVYVDLHVQVENPLDLEGIHALSHVIDQKVRSKFQDVCETSVHVEPAPKGSAKTNIQAEGEGSWDAATPNGSCDRAQHP